VESQGLKEQLALQELQVFPAQLVVLVFQELRDHPVFQAT